MKKHCVSLARLLGAVWRKHSNTTMLCKVSNLIIRPKLCQLPKRWWAKALTLLRKSIALTQLKLINNQRLDRCCRHRMTWKEKSMHRKEYLITLKDLKAYKIQFSQQVSKHQQRPVHFSNLLLFKLKSNQLPYLPTTNKKYLNLSFHQ